MSGRTAGFGLYFVSFLLLMGAGALAVAAGVTFFASLTPLYLSIQRVAGPSAKSPRDEETLSRLAAKNVELRCDPASAAILALLAEP